MGSYFARTAWRSVVMTSWRINHDCRSRLVWNQSSGEPCYCQKESPDDLFVLRYCLSSNSLCRKHDIFSSKKQKLQPVVFTVNCPDNKRRPLSRGGGLHSQLESRSSNKVGPHYLPWMRSDREKWRQSAQPMNVSMFLTLVLRGSLSSTCTDCASAYNIATSQERTPKYFIKLVCLSGMWQHGARYLCLTLRTAKTSIRFLTPSRS